MHGGRLELSGGQMQRLAVYVCVLAGSAAGRVTDGSSWACRSRTFMRSVVREDSQVGLLLFDEPSASLDPIAEHGAYVPLQRGDVFERLIYIFTDLFDRLRELRGSKTMVFSSHRFGQLTRHADLILCVDATIALPIRCRLTVYPTGTWTPQGSSSPGPTKSSYSGRGSTRGCGKFRRRHLRRRVSHCGSYRAIVLLGYLSVGHKSIIDTVCHGYTDLSYVRECSRVSRRS